MVCSSPQSQSQERHSLIISVRRALSLHLILCRKISVWLCARVGVFLHTSLHTCAWIVHRYYCELFKLHNNRPNFALFLLFSGAILQIAPVQSDFSRKLGDYYAIRSTSMLIATRVYALCSGCQCWFLTFDRAWDGQRLRHFDPALHDGLPCARCESTFWRHFDAKTDHFAKTGSGQTYKES